MAGKGNPEPRGGVQSVERALDLLELLAEAGSPQGLTQLAAASGLPLPTIHRLMGTLTERGYVRRESARRYTLGSRLVPLAESANKAFGAWVLPALRRVVDLTGETANLAMMEGDAVVYLAHVPSAHSMRMFTEPGRRVMAHCTGVGKALLAQMPVADVRALLSRTGLPAQTERTITDVDELLEELGRIRVEGFAMDNGEQEVGVRCIAARVIHAPGLMALSVSAPLVRMSEADVERIVPVVTAVAAQLGVDSAERQGVAG
ncbi:MAG TPA: IclR family transcriptional regulator [Acidothermaceae bacterium]|jgi:IclR family acetate operon transcriptional repressor